MCMGVWVFGCVVETTVGGRRTTEWEVRTESVSRHPSSVLLALHPHTHTSTHPHRLLAPAGAPGVLQDAVVHALFELHALLVIEGLDPVLHGRPGRRREYLLPLLIREPVLHGLLELVVAVDGAAADPQLALGGEH